MTNDLFENIFIRHHFPVKLFQKKFLKKIQYRRSKMENGKNDK